MKDKSDNCLYETIDDAKKKMGRAAAEIIVKDLGIENWNGKKASCPFGHSDSDPSLHWCEEESFFKCFSCGRVYSILDHYMNYGHMSYQQAARKLCESQGVEYKPPKKSKDEYFKNYVYPKEVTNESRDRVEKYLTKRHISTQTLDYAGIKEDSEGNIVFEYRDLDNVLLNVKYRPSKAIQKGQSKMWMQKGASNCPSLFNMQRIDPTKPLLCVEGELDCLSIIESGFTNAVSVPYGANSFDWIEFNWDFLENFEKIIVWADDDAPGRKMAEECVSRLGNYRTYVVKVPSEIKSQLTEAVENRIIRDDSGDANNVLIACGASAVISLINSAEDVPSKRLKYLMDANEVDIENMEKITTGYKELDRKIYGNFLPCFNIITGFTGSGKSTVSTTFSIISPIEAGYKTMVFSGELHEGQLKNWVLKPLAGRKHMVVWKNPGQPDGYTVTKQAAKAIEEYYRDKIIIYSDDNDLETPTKSLIEEMEYAYMRYGVKFFLIDNLMSVDLVAGNGENGVWESQKEFIKQLMYFTNKYCVNTTLIVHPRKPGQAREKSAYELHGASELGNISHRLFWVSTLKGDENGYNAEIEVVKDRPAAKHGAKVKLHYDYPTMRLYSDESELNKQYSWERQFDIDYPKELHNRLVCNQLDKTLEVFGEDEETT